MRKFILLALLAIISSVFWAQNILDCIPVVMEVNNQINQVVVSGVNGSAFIAWQDIRNGTNYNIYAQRASDSGVLLWNDTVTGKLICGGDSQKENLSMVPIGNTGAIIAWQDGRNGNTDIYAQWIDNNGDIAMGWAVDGLAICTDASIQSAPKMVADGLGGAFVVWSDNRGGDYDIWVRRILPDGTLSAEKRVQLEPEARDQINPAITTDGANGAIIAYEQYNGADWDIYAQRIDSSNNNMWIDGGVPACIANLDQKNPSLVNDAVGSAIIVWEDYVNTNWDIFAQRVASVPPTGAIQWTANGVAIAAEVLAERHPVIVAAGEYTAIIAWERDLSATDCNIYAHKIYGGAAGTAPTLPWGAPVLVSTSHDTWQRNPQAVPDGAGGIIVAYDSGENIGASGYDIYANHLNAAGGYTGAGVAGGYLVCDYVTDQTMPMIAYSATAQNNVIYAWLDKRNEPAPGVHDIYTLGILAQEYTLYVNSTEPSTAIYRYDVLIGFTDDVFISNDVNDLIGSYTPGPAPGGYHWVASPLIVVEGDFTEANNWTYTITFVLEEDPLPVVLSGFLASLSADNYVNLTWITQSETGVLGFYILRNTGQDLVSAVIVSDLIAATNTSSQQTYNFTDSEIFEDGTYYYWLQNSDLDGSVDFHGPISIEISVTGGDTPGIPLVTELKPIYPNPFNPTAFIPYTLANTADVSIRIYNSRGQILREYNLGTLPPNTYRMTWDGKDYQGNNLASGVYFILMTAGNDTFQRKALLLK